MEKKLEILKLRERLDKTLALPDLVNEESIKSLVKDQLLRSSIRGSDGDLGNVVTRRTEEVSNFLEMLRSASGNESGSFKAHGASDWKVKQDTEQLRVLYCEGPHGTPYHTLLAEGFADGPIDVCLCVSWESSLYKKWWPQYNIPTFKITKSTCLQKVQVGEEISLVRMKVPWPVSAREALLHYFEVEYFQEDVVLVLTNTISNMKHIDVSTHGFSSDGIPDAEDTVRVDLVGGFVLQKVSENRSYFRAIVNMDIKLDFVPPSLINFVSRQLIGNGHKLYQKAVGSVATRDEDYRKALEGPMYVRIREGLDLHNSGKTALVGLKEKNHEGLLTEENTVETKFDNQPATHHTFVTEIVEEETEHSPVSPQLKENQPVNDNLANGITDQQHVIKERAFIRPEVERALNILDRAIAMVQGGGFSSTQNDFSSVDQGFPILRAVAKADSISDRDAPKNPNTDNPSNGAEGRSPAEVFRCSTVSPTTPTTHEEANRRSSTPKERPSTPGNTPEANLNGSSHRKPIKAAALVTQPPHLDMVRVCDEQSLQANGFHNEGPYTGNNNPKRKKKQRICCLSLGLTRG